MILLQELEYYTPNELGFDLPEITRIYVRDKCYVRDYPHKGKLGADFLKDTVTFGHAHACKDSLSYRSICIYNDLEKYHEKFLLNLRHEYAHILDISNHYTCKEHLVMTQQEFNDKAHGESFYRIWRELEGKFE